MNNALQRHLSIKEAADWLGLSETTIYHWVTAKPKPKLASLKFGKRVLISLDDLESFAAANRRSA